MADDLELRPCVRCGVVTCRLDGFCSDLCFDTYIDEIRGIEQFEDDWVPEEYEPLEPEGPWDY